MHLQSCCFANLSLLLFCRSRFRRRRPCLLSSLFLVRVNVFLGGVTAKSKAGWVTITTSVNSEHFNFSSGTPMTEANNQNTEWNNKNTQGKLRQDIYYWYFSRYHVSCTINAIWSRSLLIHKSHSLLRDWGDRLNNRKELFVTES